MIVVGSRHRVAITQFSNLASLDNNLCDFYDFKRCCRAIWFYFRTQRLVKPSKIKSYKYCYNNNEIFSFSKIVAEKCTIIDLSNEVVYNFFSDTFLTY